MEASYPAGQGPAKTLVWADDGAWPQVLPRRVWDALRFLVLLITLGLVALLLMRPALGLDVFWSAAVPAVPLLLLLGPGLWRNLCPLATLNQWPRRLGRGGDRVMSAAFALPFGMAAALLLIAGRKFAFNLSATATAGLIVGALLLAFVGGLAFRGKSGWCTSLCPMLPVERLYGQSPWLKLGNAHCAPCVGCSSHCHDQRPLAAAYTEAEDPVAAGRFSLRRLFAGVFPGLVAGYFLLPDLPALEPEVLARKLVAYLGVSLLAFQVLDHLAGRRHTLALIRGFGALAFSLYYLLGWPHWLDEWWAPASPPPGVATGLGLAFTALALVWWVGGWRRDRRHEVEQGAVGRPERVWAIRPEPVGAAPPAAPRPELQIELEGQGASLAWPAGLTLLEALERSGSRPVLAGCRAGHCGSDLVRVDATPGQLAPPDATEATTLQRLGAEPGLRLACMLRAAPDAGGGRPVRVRSAAAGPAAPTDNSAGAADPAGDTAPDRLVPDPELRSVVIVGGGIAGITVADEVRRHHPGCSIHLVGSESRPAYNRMAIADLISCGRSVQGLLLRPAAWYVDHRIQAWINTQARAIDRENQTLELATGERLPYDRLVLATGAAPWRPPIEGLDRPGAFLMRDADDAIAVRADIQRCGARQAVVIGSGPLGLETAQALRALGLAVKVLSLGRGLMEPWLDAPASEILARRLARTGLEMAFGAEVVALDPEEGGARIAAVRARDGRTWPAQVVVVCTGTRPRIELAREAGLAVHEGIQVDAQMRTSDPRIFAVGDAAEFEGERPGLWPAALAQAGVAARALLGAADTYAGHLPVMDLKVEGADVCVIGRVDAPDASSCSSLDMATGRYVRLVVERGRLRGAVIVGASPVRQTLVEAVRSQWPGSEVDRLLRLALPVP